jgi:hypothetical protein
MLGAAYGNSWHEYLHCTTFAYRVAVNSTTGYSPFELHRGFSPTHPTDVTFGLIPQNSFNNNLHYFEYMNKWLRSAFQQVRSKLSRVIAQQEILKNKTSKRKQPTYKPNDFVLYWQPQLPRKYHLSSSTTGSIYQEAPGKWVPRWTGPHIITKRTSENTYNLIDTRSQQQLLNIHTDTLWPYSPWSDEEPSTSPDIDRALPWRTDNTLVSGDLFAIPLEGQDDHFGIGKFFTFDTNRYLQFQWYGNDADLWTPKATFRPGWISHSVDRNEEPYWGNQAHTRDRLYLNTFTDTNIGNASILLRGFQLNKDGTIPAAVRRAILHARLNFASDFSPEQE